MVSGLLMQRAEGRGNEAEDSSQHKLHKASRERISDFEWIIVY